jgi:murein L,D-transpeptidase YcbB/YkuD
LSLAGALRGPLLACLVLAAGPSPALVQLDPVQEVLRERVEQIRLLGSVSVSDVATTSTELLPTFYERRDFRAAWTDRAAIDQLLVEVRGSREDGLEPADYHLAAIAGLLTEASRPGAPEHTRAHLDLLLTDALIRLAYHLSFGKVDPELLDPSWNVERDLGEGSPLEALTRAIANGDIHGLLQKARPAHPLYAQLRAGLARYREIAARGGWAPIPEGPKLEAGARGERVLALRRRLAVTDELPGDETSSPVFDAGLVKAVKAFQERHALAPDGVAGAGTLEALNVPVEARIDQIRVNLERARWVLHEVQGEFLLVDIAGFQAAYVRDGQTLWRSRVQVGTPYRMTPTFKSALSYLVLNPTWTVPPTILKKDILPAVRKDPAALQKKGLRVLDRDGQPVDPATVNWGRYTAANFPYLLRQDPGPKNALGRIKFMFPNAHSVYLHDTPNKRLFDRPERTFSSGCIRIERPVDLALLLLEGSPRWDRERLDQAIASGTTRTVSLPRRVPILLLYWTTLVDESGRIGFKKDIYDRDRAVLEGLKGEVRFRSNPIV